MALPMKASGESKRPGVKLTRSRARVIDRNIVVDLNGSMEISLSILDARTIISTRIINRSCAASAIVSE